MIKKLLNKCNFQTFSVSRNSSLLTPLFIIILYLGGVSNLSGSTSFENNNSIVNSNTVLEDLTNFPKLLRSYNITDANTEDKSCFPTKGVGVIFQRADDCQGLHHIWSVKDELTFSEYDNGTATIVGTVIDEQGKIGQVNIALYDKENNGSTWNATCYLDGVSDPRSLYQSFNGTIKVGSDSYSVEKKQSEKHFILADGAGFEPGQFGFGAWTSGSFGGCTEWFGNLNPIDIDCDLTVNAGEDQSNCNLEEIVLTANAENASDCLKITSSYKIIDSNTEAGCFTADSGVIFQKGGSCKGIDYIWRAGDDLFLNEYDNDTAAITGTVIDQNGRIGIVAIKLTDKEHTGTTWNASCYLDGISGPETYYRSFYGTITADGAPVTVGTRFNAHYILANGAGFDSNQYGMGAWTGGAFGECTEWFGNLVPVQIANPTQEIEYLWSTGETTESITVTEAGEYTVTVSDCKGCTATDAVVVEFLTPKAHVIMGGANFCIDGEVDNLTDNIVSISGDAVGANNTFVVTDSDGKILGLPATFEAVKEIDFDGAGLGTCLLWNLSFEDGLQGATVGANANDLEGCFDLSASIKIIRSALPDANAGDDVAICKGDEAMLTVTGNGSYLWNTGETTASIKVSPIADTRYSVTVTSDLGCSATDEVFVTVDAKVIIGDFVWLDENKNGLQDDGATGINDVKVTLYECNGAEVASTVTADNASGEAGAYSFEVCPDSGYYYVVFDDVPELVEFTASNAGDDAQDSDANENGHTQCFNVTNVDIPTVDGGLVEKCDIKVNAGDDGEICEDEVIALTAAVLDDTAECPGGCVYPIKTQDRCYGPTGDFEVYLVSTGSVENFKFKASEQKFERLADNSVRYTATASNGKDLIEVDLMLTGYTQIAPINSPKSNACQQYDTSDWEYWTTWSGTISSRDHGIFNLSVKGAAFQMGIGADVVRTGFGASGWFYVDGGDGFYTEGDVNVTLDECMEENVSYQWTTEDGNIVGSSNQKTIQVDQPGTYTVEAINCLDCVTTDTIKLVKGFCYLEMKSRKSKMATVYPVPVQSGGTLTIEFDVNIDTSNNGDELKAVSLKAGVDYIERKEDVSVVLYNILGQMITAPRIFKIENGKATIYLDLDYIPSGKYIVRAQGPTWSDAKNIVVE